MPRYYFTLHVEGKIKEQTSKKLGITKEQIQKVIENPIAVDKSEKPALIAIGQFTKTLSLCVVHRVSKGTTRIITFYPAEKGRYERKILSG